MAPRLVTAEERLSTPILPFEVNDPLIGSVARTPTQLRKSDLNVGPGSTPENEPTNAFRIRCLEQLQTMDPGSAQRLEDALGGLPGLNDVFQGFRLVEVLGEGAFGTVYRAEQLGMASRSVAVKISADLGGETQSLAQLQHTHIMPIYSAHVCGDVHAICMPFFGRTTLADWCRELRTSSKLPTSARLIVSTLQHRHATLRHGGTSSSYGGTEFTAKSDGMSHHGLPESSESNPRIEKMEYVDAVLWIGQCLADALAHAHQRGILHRDLKPANVLLTDDGMPMILDFNLSEDIKTREAKLRVRVGGTLPFMSPEQLEVFQGGSRELDGRTDIYSLGLILFQLLTGHHPFRIPKGSPTEICRMMLEERRKAPPTLTPYNPAISPAVESIVRRCLWADPAQRYADANQLRTDLQRHLEHLPLRYATNPSMGELFSKWTRRNPWVKSPVTVGLVCTVGLLAGVNSWLLQRDHFQQQEREALTMRADELFRGISDQLQQGRVQMLDWAANPEQLRAGSNLLGQAVEAYETRFPMNQPVEILPEAQQAQLKLQIEESRRIIERSRQLLDPTQPAFQRLIQQNQPHAREAVAAARSNETAPADLTPAQRRETIDDHMATGHYREALPYLRLTVREENGNFQAWFQLGCCLEMLQDRRDGITAFTAALAAKPNWIEALRHRAKLYDELGNLRSALLDLDAIVKLEPHDFDALIRGAAILSRLERPREALERLDPIMELPGAPTSIWFTRAEIRDRVSDIRGAHADRQRGLELEPNDVTSWIARGFYRLATQPELALADFQQAEKLNPRSLHALQNQAHVYGEKLNNPEAALAALDRLLQYHPQYVPAVANRAVYLARLGRIEDAANQAQAALALSDSPYTHFRVGSTFARLSGFQVNFKKDALFHLTQSISGGYGSDLFATCSDLDPLRQDPGFRTLHQLSLFIKNVRK